MVAHYFLASSFLLGTTTASKGDLLDEGVINVLGVHLKAAVIAKKDAKQGRKGLTLGRRLLRGNPRQNSVQV